MSAAPVITQPRCYRCGSQLSYEGRPCYVCLSPASFKLVDGKIEDLDGPGRKKQVRLPEFAQPKIVRGKKVRKPRKERAIAVARQVSKWTWNSVAIALAIHMVAFAIAWFMRSDIEQLVQYVHEVSVKEQTAVAVAPAPEPEPLEVPDIEQNEDDMVVPDKVIDQDILAGDPLTETPPEEIFAPQEQVAPPTPNRPVPDNLFRPTGPQGLGGGDVSPNRSSDASGSGLFSNRKGVSRNAALRKHGGGKDTENAVNLGLEYLARRQEHNGSWDPNDGFRRRPTWATSDNGYRGCITALCTLPFLAAGHSPVDGEYKKEVRRAVDWLMEHQTSDGCINYKGIQQMYTHTVATLALCEAYGLCGDEEIGKSAERAVRFLERSQGTGGGWDYRASITSSHGNRERNDASITGWAVLALKSARAVGIRVNERHTDAMADLYDRLSIPSGETHYADASHGSIPASRKGIGMVGVGLTCRVILDRGRFETRNYAAEKLLLAELPSWDKFKDEHHDTVNANFNTFYGVYYGTLGMFLLNNGQGPAWEKWNKALKETLIENQDTRGARKGSWPAVDTWIGGLMGDLYSTALSVLCLEVYYRYNPMHRPSEDGVVRMPRKPIVGSEVENEEEPPEEFEDPVVISGQTLDLAKTGDRSKYLRLLARDKGMGAVSKLIDHLDDDSLTVRSTALYELGKLEAKDAATPVQRMLTDPDDQSIRLTVISTLGSLGDRSVYQSLTKLLNSREESLKHAAESALRKLSDGEDFGTNKRAWEHWFRTNP